MSELQRFISVDVETAGPHPAEYSLLSIGACLVSNPKIGFYTEIKPVNDRQTPEAFSIHRLTLEELAANGDSPADAMADFEAWLSRNVPDGRPIFVAFNAPFDWMFVNDYFHRYLGRNPFGHSALDIKAYYMGRFGVAWAETTMALVAERVLGHQELSHHALKDAQDQAEMFQRIHRASSP
ncbi:MAG: 3'-5' exonuclease [Anaerolineales bacterium]|nr:3'-5' exonuclease [Anaerolineales bacterium]